MILFRLPRRSDLERKIEIYNFSARTRQLFIRLLALVKWANSASKVDKSSVSLVSIHCEIQIKLHFPLASSNLYFYIRVYLAYYEFFG